MDGEDRSDHPCPACLDTPHETVRTVAQTIGHLFHPLSGLGSKLLFPGQNPRNRGFGQAGCLCNIFESRLESRMGAFHKSFCNYLNENHGRAKGFPAILKIQGLARTIP
jgi:hypothetical protein